MPTQEDEKKPKVETQQGPETPEQAAARAAGVAQEEKEKAAAAALAGAETEVPVEASKEKKKIQDVRYLHVDDDWDTRDEVARGLTEKLGMTGKVGEAKSLQGAVELVQRLAQEDKLFDLILLDRSFPTYEKGQLAAETSGDNFLRQFEELAKDPQFKEQLKDVKIIMMTSHAGDARTMEKFRKLSSRVIGGLEKTGEVDTEKLKAMLAEAGVVQESE